MKSVVVVIALGLAAAACAESTNSVTPPAADGIVTVDSAVPVDDAVTADADASVVPSTVAEVVGDEQNSAEPSITEPPPTTEPSPIESSTTDPSTTGESPIEPTPTSGSSAESNGAFDGVATFYGGSGQPGQAWVPLGWWDGAAWNRAGYDEAGRFIEPPVSDVAEVSVTGLDLGDGANSVVDGLSLGDRQEYCVGEETGPLIDLPTASADTAASLGYDLVAVSADWPLQPRPVRQIGLEVPEYVTVGAGLFPSIPDAATTGEVLQVVRVDLDGDSIEAVLVTFENITEDFGAAGDFSGVYARYPSADGTVIDELVVAHIPDAPVDFPTIGRFTIAAVADLNGDSVMEVLVRDMFWESAGLAVFALEAGRLVQVAGGGCGV